MPDNNRTTPAEVAWMVLSAVPYGNPVDTIADVGCGPTGIWGYQAQSRFGGRVIYNDIVYYGASLMENGRFDHGRTDRFICGDFLSSDIDGVFKECMVDLWVCNPPYPKAEMFFWTMRNLSHPYSRILMFLNIGWLEGKDRRNRIFDVVPPSLIVFLDGRIIDKTHPGENGSDNRGRIGIYWDLKNKVKPGDTKCKWVGSDNPDDYRVKIGDR